MEKYKRNVLIIVAVVTLLLAVGGATFAYFQAQGGSTSQANVNVITHTTDSLTFEVGKPINIQADFSNFKEGMDNRTDTTVARATLKANSATNDARANYYIYLDITTNEFKYTTEEKTAELILTILDPNDNPVTSINGLKYVTVDGVSGFDVTEVSDLITIANNYEIHSTGTKVDEWDITLTLINLDSNQNANTGKRFNGTLLVQKTGRDLASYIKSLYTTQGENGLYYHDGSLSGGANDNSYRYSSVLLGLDTVELDETLFRIVHFKDLNIHTENIDYEGDVDFIFYREAFENALSDWGALDYTDEQIQEVVLGIVSKYANGTELTVQEQQIVWLFLTSSYKSKEEAMMDAYAQGLTNNVSELPINNYVCFGSEDDNCPEDNLYRIIGVFNDKVKLVKNKSIGQMAWDTNGTAQDWSDSSLQSYLNNEFLNTLDYYSKLVALNSWNISDFNIDQFNAKSASSVLSAETQEEKTFDAKVGLMYASDFAYSNNIEGWNSTVSDPDSSTPMPTNWLHTGKLEWLINKQLNPGNAVGIYGHFVNIWYSWTFDNSHEVRPSFYLEPTVMYDRGTGTISDPYRIK